MKYLYHLESNIFKGHVAGEDGQFTYLELVAQGNTLDELLQSATIGVEDWNANNCWHIDIGDMDKNDYELACRVVIEYYKRMKEALG